MKHTQFIIDVFKGELMSARRPIVVHDKQKVEAVFEEIYRWLGQGSTRDKQYAEAGWETYMNGVYELADLTKKLNCSYAAAMSRQNRFLRIARKPEFSKKLVGTYKFVEET